MHSQSDGTTDRAANFQKVMAQSLHVRLHCLLQTCDEAIAELRYKYPGISFALQERNFDFFESSRSFSNVNLEIWRSFRYVSCYLFTRFLT